MKENWTIWNVYDFLVDYESIDVHEFLDISI